MERSLPAVLVATTLLTSLACSKKDEGGAGAPAAGSEKKILIGLSRDTLKEERWQRDRDLFVERAKELGADVIVNAANGDAALQEQQAREALNQGVKALVVVPVDTEKAAAIATAAQEKKVPVISYDRLIRDANPQQSKQRHGKQRPS